VRAVRKSTAGAALPTKEETMIRTLMIAAASAAVLMFSPAAFAQQTGGTADEAKAMLMKAVAAVKADKAKALDMFTKGEGGFLDRDLYVFCSTVSDGKIVALGNPNAKQNIGVDTRTLKDSTGKPFGAELYAGYQKPEGEITEVNYMFPRPGADKTPVPKVSLVTRVGDLGCGVGYYK
jgi:Single Cache domain 2